jgi:glucose dehydrogenase
MAGGALATAGGLVFAGRTSGWFDAYDAETGERRWSFRTGAGCNSGPVTYRVGGRQYVAVACGGHGLLDPQSGDALVAFSLGPD